MPETWQEMKRRHRAERVALLRAELAVGPTVTAVSERVGLDRCALHRLMREHGLRLEAPAPRPKQRHFHKLLSEAELADFRLLRRRMRYSIDDALRAIKRADLIDA